MTIKYIELSFKEACRQKHAEGVKLYRGGDASQPFHGDACEEAYQETLDLHHYLVEMEESRNCDMSHYKHMVEEIAYAVQRANRVYPRSKPREIPAEVPEAIRRKD